MHVSHPDVVVAGDVLGEERREILSVDDAAAKTVDLAVDEVERDVEDDTEETVAADGGAKQVGFPVGSYCVDDAVRGHDSQRSDAGGQAALPKVQAVRVYRHGAAHAEDVDAGHGRDRETERVHCLEHVVPTRPCADGDGATHSVNPNCVHPTHVEEQRPGRIAWPPMACLVPAIETVSSCARANAKASRTSATVRGTTTP